jgi:hypothetical protein
MGAASERAPDGIDPFVGYRAWTFALDRQGVSLYPLSGFGRPSVWNMAVRGWATASCLVHWREGLRMVRECACGGDDPSCPTCIPFHAAPQEGCTCGFYALKGVPLGLSYGTSHVVFGRVDLAGKVIEHDFGYRAERARIVELIPIVGAQMSALHVANRLGIPIGLPPRPDVAWRVE